MTTLTAGKPAILSKPDVLEGINVIDVDTHLAETHDLWVSRAPLKYKDRVPQVKPVNGKPMWVIDGDKLMGPSFALSTIRKDGSKALGMEFTTWEFDDCFKASYDIKARIAYMDEANIAAQITYPNLLGFGNQKGGNVDSELRYVVTQIYNDAMAEVQHDSGGRIFPMSLMPWWDIKQATAEAERCHNMGLHGINTHTDPQEIGLPVISDEHWSPLWEMCEDFGMPVNFHIGASFESSNWFGAGAWPTDDENLKLAYGSTMMVMSNYRVLANILLSGFLDRFPKLKMVSVESGLGWIPMLLESLEYQMGEVGRKLKSSPTEVFSRQLYACSWFEKRHWAQTARDIGIDNVMFETDFPHPTCLYPNPLN